MQPKCFAWSSLCIPSFIWSGYDGTIGFKLSGKNWVTSLHVKSVEHHLSGWRKKDVHFKPKSVLSIGAALHTKILSLQRQKLLCGMKRDWHEVDQWKNSITAHKNYLLTQWPITRGMICSKWDGFIKNWMFLLPSSSTWYLLRTLYDPPLGWMLPASPFMNGNTLLSLAPKRTTFQHAWVSRARPFS